MKRYKLLIKKKNRFLEMATVTRFSKNGYYYLQVVGSEGIIPHFHLTDQEDLLLKIKIPDSVPESYSEFEYLNYDKMKKYFPDNITSILKYVVYLLSQKPDKKAHKGMLNYLEVIKREWDVNNPNYSKFGYKPF
jgi:hypothetical protein